MNMPQPLVSSDWLADNLDSPDLVIFDTTLYLRHKEGGGYLPESGRENFEQSHIPGAQFFDHIKEFANPDIDIPFMMPEADAFAELLKPYGVSDNSLVVFYNDGIPMWSTRAWWMFRSVGLNNVAVLDGGLKKWRAEGRPTEKGSASAPRRAFQGWRYLKDEDAPPDLTKLSGDADLPAKMRLELAELGLL